MTQKDQRQQILKDELARMVTVIASDYKPLRVIVFGSYAKGEIGQWSDLDIAIVKSTNKRFLDRSREVARIADAKVATDFLVYTPQEYEHLCQTNSFVRDEISLKGKVLYETN